MYLQMFFHCQGENPFSGNQDDQDPEDSMAMDVSELELTSEAVDSQTDEAPVKDELVAEGGMGQEAAEGEAGSDAAAAAEEEKMEEKMEEELGMEGEEEQGNQEEEEGFEVGEEEEEGYVVRDEIGEEGLQAELEEEEEEEGLEAAEVEEEDKNDEWLWHPVCNFSSLPSSLTSQWPPQSHRT